MSITSAAFAGFTLIVLAVYYLLPGRLQNIWLLAASCLFYVTWDWRFVLPLLLLTGANYAFGLWLGTNQNNRAAYLWVCIALNLLVLAFFKFGYQIQYGLATLLDPGSQGATPDILGIILPLGLSFRVLENIAYLVDIHRKQITPSRDFLTFALYQVYFPKMAAGPIENARSFLPKLTGERVVTNETLRRSFMLIIVGLFRKIVIADSLNASITSSVFISPSDFPAPELLAWLFVYAFALYNDFAGYTSIMRGVSGLFGVELSPNFNFPYFARSFSEFWNRWHMTLSFWLRDYVFFPLRKALLTKALSKMNWLTLAVPPMVTMLVSGLWHGTGWNMLVWAMLHGFYLIIERLLRQNRPHDPAGQAFGSRLLSMGVTFLLVSLAWAPFRMELPVALEYWYALFDLQTYSVLIEYPRLFMRQFFVIVFLLLAIGFDWLQQRLRNEFFLLDWPRPVQSFLLAGVLFLLFIATFGHGDSPFVYQGF